MTFTETTAETVAQSRRGNWPFVNFLRKRLGSAERKDSVRLLRYTPLPELAPHDRLSIGENTDAQTNGCQQQANRLRDVTCIQIGELDIPGCRETHFLARLHVHQSRSGGNVHVDGGNATEAPNLPSAIQWKESTIQHLDLPPGYLNWPDQNNPCIASIDTCQIGKNTTVQIYAIFMASNGASFDTVSKDIRNLRYVGFQQLDQPQYWLSNKPGFFNRIINFNKPNSHNDPLAVMAQAQFRWLVASAHQPSQSTSMEVGLKQEASGKGLTVSPSGKLQLSSRAPDHFKFLWN